MKEASIKAIEPKTFVNLKGGIHFSKSKLSPRIKAIEPKTFVSLKGKIHFRKANCPLG